jgi:hypothetical protein
LDQGQLKIIKSPLIVDCGKILYFFQLFEIIGEDDRFPGKIKMEPTAATTILGLASIFLGFHE